MKCCFYVLLLVALGVSKPTEAQYREMKRFTTQHGLAGNTVYRCTEDHQGYLWICTESGISRFDGKQFQNFTTEQGLPDNEVLQVVCDRDDKIWVSCFHQGASYFDQEKNRFINTKDNPNLNLPSSSSYILLSSLPKGGVQYRSSQYTAVIIDNKPTFYYHTDLKDTLVFYDVLDQYRMLKIDGNNRLKHKDSANIRHYHLRYKQNNTWHDTLFLEGNFSASQFEKNNLYLLDLNLKFIVRVAIAEDGVISKKDTIFLHELGYRFFVGNQYLFVNNRDGSADVYDLKTGQFNVNISGDFVVNAVYEDRFSNLWVSTRNQGLILYAKSSIASYDKSVLQSHAVYSFLSPERNEYYAGLDDNTVLYKKNNSIQIKPLVKRNAPGNVFAMNLYKQKFFAFSETNTTINFKEIVKPSSIYLDQNKYKCVFPLNAHTLLLGGYNRLDLLNMINDSLHINRTNLRANACAALNKDSIWIGSIDGLWLMRSLKEAIRSSCKHTLLKERITDLVLDEHKVLWVATASSGMYALQHEKVICHYHTKNGLPSNQVNHIYCDPTNQIWLATAAGVSILRKQTNKAYAIQNITEADGLINKQVHSFYAQRDTMFLSTSQGVQTLPIHFNVFPYAIPVAIHRVVINDQDTSILPYYQLPYQSYNITLDLGGIELLGHFDHIDYRLKGNPKWTALEGNALNLNLGSGVHQLDLRTVDVNGNKSDTIRSIVFEIATPFWFNLWFWIPLLLLLQGGIAWYWYHVLQRKNKKRQLHYEEKMRVATLEQQAYTSLLNPHFIFNSLNGLHHFLYSSKKEIAEHYIERLTKLIRQSFEMAQQTFVSLDDEIAHINQYVSLEQQRYEASFEFIIKVDPAIDTEEVMIPTMLLQPLVENVFVHANLQANPNGLLEIYIEEQANGICYIIRDNGMGIQAKHRTAASPHVSRGSQLIAKRLQALGLLCNKEITLRYRTPFPNETFEGFEVQFMLPASLYAVWQDRRAS